MQPKAGIVFVPCTLFDLYLFDPCDIFCFFLIFFAFVSVDILPLPYPSVYTVALLCRCPEALKEESPGRAGAAGLDTLVSGIPELYNGRTTTLCAAKIYAKDLHLTKSYSHTCF